MLSQITCRAARLLALGLHLLDLLSSTPPLFNSPPPLPPLALRVVRVQQQHYGQFKTLKCDK